MATVKKNALYINKQGGSWKTQQACFVAPIFSRNALQRSSRKLKSTTENRCYTKKIIKKNICECNSMK
jgi:hypothetical protein